MTKCNPSILTLVPCSQPRAIYPWVCCALLTTWLGAAQPPPSVDEAWANVQLLRRNAAAPVVHQAVKGTDQARVQQEERAKHHASVARAAREFHTTFPGHPKSAEARKLETLAGIEGIAQGDRSQQRAILLQAHAYRKNPGNPVSSRFEVAQSVERLVLSWANRRDHWLANPAGAERMADRLWAEFGELPELHSLYLNIAEHSACENAGFVATRLMQSTAAPPIKAAARRVVERAGLLGRLLDAPLSPVGAPPTRLANLMGERTVLVAASADDRGSTLRAIQRLQRQAPAGTRWIIVSFGPATPPSASKAVSAPIVGTRCSEPLGRLSPLYEQLKLSRLPYAYVFNAKRELVGFGETSAIPALLLRAQNHSATGTP